VRLRNAATSCIVLKAPCCAYSILVEFVRIESETESKTESNRPQFQSLQLSSIHQPTLRLAAELTMAQAELASTTSYSETKAAAPAASSATKKAKAPQWREREAVLRAQAKQGHVGSTVALCRLLHRVGARQESADLLQTLCALGNAWAMLATARRTRKALDSVTPSSSFSAAVSSTPPLTVGELVPPKEEQEAWLLVSRAAELGHHSAVCEVFERMRQLHLRDLEVGAGSSTSDEHKEEKAASDSESVRWFALLAKLALRGHVTAGYCAGLALRFGMGTQPSAERASVLLDALARSGHHEAKTALHALHQHQKLHSVGSAGSEASAGSAGSAGSGAAASQGLFALATEVAPGVDDFEADADDYQSIVADAVRSLPVKLGQSASAFLILDGEEWDAALLEAAPVASVAAAAVQCKLLVHVPV
jgi:hypothetical protein